jgi:hypothetical protein
VSLGRSEGEGAVCATTPKEDKLEETSKTQLGKDEKSYSPIKRLGDESAHVSPTKLAGGEQKQQEAARVKHDLNEALSRVAKVTIESNSVTIANF